MDAPQEGVDKQVDVSLETIGWDGKKYYQVVFKNRNTSQICRIQFPEQSAENNIPIALSGVHLQQFMEVLNGFITNHENK